MHPLLQKQEVLHKEATKLLKQIVYPILNKFGEIKVGGSYAYKLLSYPDIDVDVINQNITKELYADLCTQFLLLNSVSRFRAHDKIHFPLTHDSPQGYQISPEIHFDDNIWKLDIWFQTPEWYTDNRNNYAEKLTTINDAQKISILSLKNELLDKDMYGVNKKYQSVDVYDVVLNGNVQTLAELQTYKSRSI